LVLRLAAQDAKPGAPAGIAFEKDIKYGTGGGEDLKLDLARPEKASGRLPCVVVIHGGAWRAGNKSMHVKQTWDFAQRGYVAATVGYRFCPKHLFPAQVEDVKCAVRFLRAHADEYGLDPDRIGAVGFSAGAHLSMMLGVMGKDDGLEGDGGWPDQSSQVQAVVAYFGPTDMAAADIPDVSKPLLRDLIGGTPQEKPEEHKRASPITYASAGDAPTLIFQGTKDPLVPHTQAYKMVDALTAAGVPGRAELIVGAGHGWGGKDLERTVNETYAFFDEHLKSKAKPTANEAKKDDGWVNLLAPETKKLDEHWTTTGNWNLKDGVATLTPRPDEKGWSRFDAYLWSKKKYTDFEIEFEYKVEKGGNSGFYFRVGDVSDPVQKGIEVQIYDSPSGDPNAKLTDHDAGGIIPGLPAHRRAAKPAGQWNKMSVRHWDNKIVVILNDVNVNAHDLGPGGQLAQRPRTGSIGFQDHALPISLRNVRIKEL
jgi:acetyl esterase/lipase